MTDTKTHQIFFNDGAAYERYMGKWSQLAGETFLGWLAPEAGQRWLDVGCGNGAFTEMLIERCDPASVHGIDPSEQQLAYARARPALRAAQLDRGDAMALPFADNSFDVYTISFGIRNVTRIPDALREAYRVLRPGGRLMVLEFSQIPNEGLQWLYDRYSFNVIPVMGQIIAKDRDSYQYLVESIRRFPDQTAFKRMIEQAGFSRVSVTNLSGGIAAIHHGWAI